VEQIVPKLLASLRNPQQVTQVEPPVGAKKHGRAQEKAFAADTAAATGQTESSISGGTNCST
jgi:hypothetical protein